MEHRERTIVYGLVAACICGIIIIGFFLMYTGGQMYTSQGFSEVYFEEHQKLPEIITENEPLDFSFKVVSHNKETMAYSYGVTAGDQTIRSGSFILPQTDSSNSDSQQKYTKTIFIEDIKLKPTLLTLNNSQVSETRFTYNGGLGLLLPRDGTEPQLVTDPSKLYYPVKLPIGDQSAILIFNPDTHETFQTTSTSKTLIGDITTIRNIEESVEIDGQRFSQVGFDISDSEWTIKNDLGIISAVSKTTTTHYRYTFKKISVDVTASPLSNPEERTYYEIHFWIVVTDPSQR